jgi:hypothetical protein
VTCFSVYPYQIGQDNEEAIQSGAFWFYRKLGFRPGRRDLLAITEEEEDKIDRDPGHRTSPSALRKLANGHMFFELGDGPRGRWDSFSVRTLGLKVQKKMAAQFDGEARNMRSAATEALCKALDVDLGSWNASEQKAFDNFSVALSLAPEVARWTKEEKRAVIEIVRAKAGHDETRYLRLMQRHDALRTIFLKLASQPDTDRR